MSSPNETKSNNGDPVTNNAVANDSTASTSATSSSDDAKNSSSAAAPVDPKLNKDLMELLKIVAILVALGAISHLYGEDKLILSVSHIDSFPAFFRFLNIEAHSPGGLCSYWPQNLVVTFAILNGVRSNSAGHWAGNIINAVFHIFGGLIVNDILNASAVADFVFWDYLPTTIVCWYLVNHNVPMTKYNVWNLLTENKVMNVLPLAKLMNICTMAFNCSLLFSVARQHEASSFWGLPMVAKGVFFCVAVHCSSDFFGAKGININFNSCSNSANRAVLVYFWIATKGMSTLGTQFLKDRDTNGLERITVEGFGHFFGDTATDFCWAIILLSMLFADFDFMNKITMPHLFVQSHLSSFLFDKDNSGDDNIDYDDDMFSGGTKNDDSLEARVAALEAQGSSSTALTSASSFWEDKAWFTIFSIIMFGAIGFFFEDAKPIGFDHIQKGSFFHSSMRFLSFESNKHPLHADHWPQTILMTLVIWNGVKGKTNGYWANNIIQSVFAIYGGMIMYDMLNAKPVTDYSFWSYLPVTIATWYLVNHDLPKTSINVFSTIEDYLKKICPFQDIMDLCTLSFNCSLLFTVASEHEASNFWFMPQVAKGAFFCVAVHCANDFFGQDGINISFDACSEAANRAFLVYFWTATNGLSTLGVPNGETNGIAGVTTYLYDFFGSGRQFLWAMILLGQLFGNRIPFAPATTFQSFLKNFFKP